MKAKVNVRRKRQTLKLDKHVKGARLAVGSRLTVRITRNGFIGRAIQLKVRSNSPPRARTSASRPLRRSPAPAEPAVCRVQQTVPHAARAGDALATGSSDGGGWSKRLHVVQSSRVSRARDRPPGDPLRRCRRGWRPRRPGPSSCAASSRTTWSACSGRRRRLARICEGIRTPKGLVIAQLSATPVVARARIGRRIPRRNTRASGPQPA